MDTHKEEWEKSYLNHDNFVFYPHEEVIRFVSRYIVKRTGLNQFQTIHTHNTIPKILDVGCGIGRHIIYCFQIGLDPYGIDLSHEAIKTAHKWTSDLDLPNYENHIRRGDIQNIPWESEYFHYAISHGVLDSMYFDVAKRAIKEIARILKENSLFYLDLVSGDDSNHAREFAGEEIVKTQHEKGTVQMYYNYSKILELIDNCFSIVEMNLIRNENVLTGNYHSRYHLVLKKV
ncbi:class I SAM-dependent methyltransferase [Candidatus Formimonas warabiya]|uniref:class I SAM-dependent methyltransferase n=1 Tax=Formimonas warabiya TaxID=1761012 RepID=UPI0011D0F493|nr:class I SAM-dependent methyltransferase [Candidatus Formimonas warabiya]